MELSLKGDKTIELLDMLDVCTREALARGYFPYGANRFTAADEEDPFAYLINATNNAQGPTGNVIGAGGPGSGIGGGGEGGGGGGGWAGVGSAAFVDGRLLLRSYLNKYPMLPRPPMPEALRRARRGYFEAPKSQRDMVARERAEEERLEQEMARLAREALTERNQRQMQQGREDMKRYRTRQGGVGGEDEDEDGGASAGRVGGGASDGEVEGGTGGGRRHTRRQNRSVFNNAKNSEEIREQMQRERLDAVVCGVSSKTVSKFREISIPMIPARIGGTMNLRSSGVDIRRSQYRPEIEESEGNELLQALPRPKVTLDTAAASQASESTQEQFARDIEAALVQIKLQQQPGSPRSGRVSPSVQQQQQQLFHSSRVSGVSASSVAPGAGAGGGGGGITELKEAGGRGDFLDESSLGSRECTTFAEYFTDPRLFTYLNNRTTSEMGGFRQHESHKQQQIAQANGFISRLTLNAVKAGAVSGDAGGGGGGGGGTGRGGAILGAGRGVTLRVAPQEPAGGDYSDRAGRPNLHHRNNHPRDPWCALSSGHRQQPHRPAHHQSPVGVRDDGDDDSEIEEEDAERGGGEREMALEVDDLDAVLSSSGPVSEGGHGEQAALRGDDKQQQEQLGQGKKHGRDLYLQGMSGYLAKKKLKEKKAAATATATAATAVPARAKERAQVW